jgi:hypothetical protein
MTPSLLSQLWNHHLLIFVILMTKMTFSFPNVFLVFMNSQIDKEQALWMEMPLVNSQVNE